MDAFTFLNFRQSYLIMGLNSYLNRYKIDFANMALFINATMLKHHSEIAL